MLGEKKEEKKRSLELQQCLGLYLKKEEELIT